MLCPCYVSHSASVYGEVFFSGFGIKSSRFWKGLFETFHSYFKRKYVRRRISVLILSETRLLVVSTYFVAVDVYILDAVYEIAQSNHTIRI